MKPLKTFSLIIALLACFTTAYGQGWEHVYDFGGIAEYAENIYPVNGGYAVGGNSRDNNLVNTPIVFKIDEQGQRLWTRKLHPSVNFLYKGMAVTSTGDFLLYGTAAETNANRMFVAKISSTGDSLWFKVFGRNATVWDARALAETTTGEILVVLQTGDSIAFPHSGEGYMRLSATGDSLGLKMTDTSGPSILVAKMIPTFDHQFVVSGQHGAVTGAYLAKINASGDTIWRKSFFYPNGDVLPWDVVQTRDSGFVMAGIIIRQGIIPTGEQKFRSFLFKTNKNGDSLWLKEYPDAADYTVCYAVTEDTQGRLAMGEFRTIPGNNLSGYKPSFRLLDANGNSLLTKTYNALPGEEADISAITRTPSGGYILAGGKGFANVNTDAYLIRTDSIGNVYPSRITGNVYHDANINCVDNAGELPMKEWIIKATNAGSDYFTVTDTLGNYSLDCDTGTYVLSSIATNSYWTIDSVCTDSATVLVAAGIDSVHRDIAANARVNAPQMQVHVSAPFLRYCTAGAAYSVRYCNLGTQTATNVYAEIILDAGLLLDSASIAYTSLGNNLYRFNIGTVNANDCGSFGMFIRASCSLTGHSTHCVSAHIYPDSSAIPPSIIWDHAHLELQSTCRPDSLQFRVINSGSPMSSPVRYSIIQDDVLFANGTINLGALQQFTTSVPANGSTWTFITTQTSGHPGNNKPVLSVEGCGTNSQGHFSTGYALMFPQNDQDLFFDILCLQDITSHDPNSKTTEPKGLNASGQIDAAQPIAYTINFQNTGTDTAFMVTVLDTISNLLEMSTLRVVGASHPFHWHINNGNALEFDFSPISLPDSSVNEPGSNGFISFIISPKTGLPIGSEIHNTGYIYFDANPPVATNTTLNTIGVLLKTWLAVNEISDVQNHLYCYPNPTNGILMLEYKGANDDAMFTVYDVLGNQVFQQHVTAGLQQLNISHLNSSVYMYQLTGKGETASGKITKF